MVAGVGNSNGLDVHSFNPSGQEAFECFGLIEGLGSVSQRVANPTLSSSLAFRCPISGPASGYDP